MSDAPARHRRPVRTLLIMGVLALAGAMGFGALGVWQVQRLAWKNELVAAIETRAHAAPLDLGTADWSQIDPEASQYQRVAITGTYLPQDTLVQAVTAEGGGFWVMTPLRMADGRTVLINRGFVPPSAVDSVHLGQQVPVAVTGLLRPSEPGGGFLRSNDATNNRWYSRDVAAIAETQGLTDYAPFFIDANRTGNGYPVGGLTVLSFSNNHLVYALTWFGLAAMLLAGFGYVLWDWRHASPRSG